MNICENKNNKARKCKSTIKTITLSFLVGLLPVVGLADMPMTNTMPTANMNTNATTDSDLESMKADIAKMKEDLAMIKESVLKQKDPTAKMKMGQKKGMKSQKDKMMGMKPDKSPDMKPMMEKDDDSMSEMGGMGDM